MIGIIETNLKYDYVFETMVSNMVDYIIDSNLDSVVLGVSGGIDSTVVACLLREVSDRVNKTKPFTFVGVSMPTETTNPDEFKISELVGNAFCDDFKMIDITNEANSIVIPRVGEFVNPLINNNVIRIGNVKSRLRMIHLYDLAKAYKGIVIGTDNYTEYLLGYSTIGGDALFDYNPIQFLWKTEVYRLADYLLNIYIEHKQWDKVHAVSDSIDIEPQAGLGISATDMREIGADNYFVVDDILYTYINLKPGDKENPTVEKYGIDTVLTVIDRMHKNEYKRNLPILPLRFNYDKVLDN